MQLRLTQLRRVAKQTGDRERAGQALRVELRRELGPTLGTPTRLAELAETANERLDEIEFLGESKTVTVRPSVLLKFANDQSAELRRLAVRLLPERFAVRFSSDADAAVRHAAARKLPAEQIVEMARLDPTDSVLRELLAEAKSDDVKKSAKDLGDELSDAYYTTLAQNLIHDYGRRMEWGWERAAVKAHARSMQSMGVKIDEERLLDAIADIVEDRDDDALEEPDARLHEVVELFKTRARGDAPVMPIIPERCDPVADLLESGKSGTDFLTEAFKLFSVRTAQAPLALRKFRLAEGLRGGLEVPVNGRVPSGGTPRDVDERALDAMCEAWNLRHGLAGEPVTLSWALSPLDESGISFSVDPK